MVGTKHIILGIHVTDRMKRAGVVQELFTEYGCYIKTRLGLHDVSETRCSQRGVIVLELFGDEEKCSELKEKLTQVVGIEVQEMVFRH